MSFSQTSPSPLAHAAAFRRPFEISTAGAAVIITFISIVCAGAAHFIADAGPSPDALSVGTLLWRVLATIAVAIRSPAPALLLAMVLERLFPLTPGQRDLTRGFYQDVAWYAVDYIRQLSWIPVLFALLFSLKRYTMGNRELLPDGLLPAPILWLIGILAGDFLAYWSHRLRHRIGVLWNFHAIHHSQPELNFFTQNRFHDVDIVIDLTIRILPLLLLNAGWTVTGVYAAISLVHFRLYHSNIRSDYGVLRYILVTPQSHRIHHGRDPRHLNRNFGVFFSFWDRAFGTQYERYEEYPTELGIWDESFPIEQGTPLRAFPRVFAAQVLYPFRRMLDVA